MSEYTYNTLVKKAKEINTAVKKEYKKPSGIWSYYFAKEILNPKKAIPKITIKGPEKSSGDHFSRQIYRSSYDDMAKRLVKYVENKEQIPNNIKVGTKLMRVSDYTYMFSRILAYYAEHGAYPKYANVNSKAFTKPTETGNVVYDYVTKKTGRKFKTIDEVLTYVQKHGRYIFEFDDVRSNKEVTDCMCGNCTDWLQWLWNMAKAMGYDCRAIHVKCRVSGTGHVRGQFKHPVNTGGKWIDRDPAAVADGGSITSIWCGDGYVLATNPSWFLANLNR